MRTYTETEVDTLNQYIDRLEAEKAELVEALISCHFELQVICEDLIRESTTHAQLASLTQAKAAIHKAGHLCRIEAASRWLGVSCDKCTYDTRRKRNHKPK